MSPVASLAWRVFPWNPRAAEGEPGSPGYAPEMQGQGRFDLPESPRGVLYLAETPEHAIAELLQAYRGRTLKSSHLVIESRALALVSYEVSETLRENILDLCRPETLISLDIGPDRTASRSRAITQQIAARIHQLGWSGLRWWSAFFGEWHTIVLFRDRLEPLPAPGMPEALALDHPAVVEAARALGIGIY